MVGGSRTAVERAEPIFRTLAPTDGYRARRPHRRRPLRQDGAQRHRVRHAAGVRRRLRDPAPVEDSSSTCTRFARSGITAAWCAPGCNELAERAFAEVPSSTSIRGYVDDSGEGRWTVQEAIDQGVPAPVITLSLADAVRVPAGRSFSAKVIAALRNEFGGHAVKQRLAATMAQRRPRRYAARGPEPVKRKPHACAVGDLRRLRRPRRSGS